jgi:hypothetical protein
LANLTEASARVRIQVEALAKRHGVSVPPAEPFPV